MATMQGEPKKILIVEDNPETADMIQASLELTGYRVVKLHAVGQALQALIRESPDLVLLDVMMPDVSGLELCRYVRRDPRFEKLPIVVMSAMAQAEDIKAGLDAGATNYLTKPFTQDEFLTAVRQALGR